MMDNFFIVRTLTRTVQKEDDDTECDHAIADVIVIEALRLLGQDKLADEYYKIDKWFA